MSTTPKNGYGLVFSFEKPNIEFLGFELRRYINITVETIKI